MSRSYLREYYSYQSAINGRVYWRRRGYICGKLFKKGRNRWRFYCKKIGKGNRGWW